jgi:D-alanine-D-alanine ligase
MTDRTKAGGHYAPEDIEAVERMKTALAELEHYRFRYLDNHETLLESLRAHPPPFVLNFCDTGFRNIAARELHIPALLEMLDIPYSGAGPAAMVRCFDKALVCALAASHGIPVPAERFLPRGEWTGAEFPYPAILKPNHGDGSFGITRDAVVADAARAERRCAELRDALAGEDLLIQEFLPGDEFTVGLIGNPGDGLQALPPLQVDYDRLEPALPRILSYESKTIPDSPYWTQLTYRPAALDVATRERLAGWSKLLFRRLECRDYARFDFRRGADGEIRLLEVNPNPAWCWDGKMNIMAEIEGCAYSGFLRRILEAGRRRRGLPVA